LQDFLDLKASKLSGGDGYASSLGFEAIFDMAVAEEK